MSEQGSSGISFAEFQPAMRAGAGGHGFPLVCIQRVSSGVSLGFHVEPDSKANGLPCRRRARSTFDSALIALTGRPATMRKCGFSVMICSPRKRRIAQSPAGMQRLPANHGNAGRSGLARTSNDGPGQSWLYLLDLRLPHLGDAFANGLVECVSWTFKMLCDIHTPPFDCACRGAFTNSNIYNIQSEFSHQRHRLRVVVQGVIVFAQFHGPISTRLFGIALYEI